MTCALQEDSGQIREVLQLHCLQFNSVMSSLSSTSLLNLLNLEKLVLGSYLELISMLLSIFQSAIDYLRRFRMI